MKSECIVGIAWREPGSGAEGHRGAVGGPRAPRRGHAGQDSDKRNGWASRSCELLQPSRMKHNYGNSYDNYYNHFNVLDDNI